MMANQTFKLVTPQVRGIASKAVSSAPDGWVVRISPPPRTLAQNAGTHVLYEIIAQSLLEDDALGWKCFCKLHYGVPILRAEDEEFRAVYDAAIKGLTYEQKLSVMRYFPVTSLMNKKQINKYIEALQGYFGPLGVCLELEEAAAC